jgi:hypothetical protein
MTSHVGKGKERKGRERKERDGATCNQSVYGGRSDGEIAMRALN